MSSSPRLDPIKLPLIHHALASRSYSIPNRSTAPELDAAAIVRQARRLRFRVRPGARRRAGGGLSRGPAGIGPDVRRAARLRAGRRRPPPRLERHGPAGQAVRPAVRRGAGADALADRRRLGQPAVRARGPDQGRPRRAGRGAAGHGGDPERRPRRGWPWSATGSRRSSRPRRRHGTWPGSCARWSRPRPRHDARRSRSAWRGSGGRRGGP